MEHDLGRRLPLPAGTDAEQRLAVFHRLPVFDKDTNQFAAFVGLDFIHKLHGFHDAEGLPRLDMRAYFRKGFGTRARSLVVRSHNRRLDQVQVLGRPWLRHRGWSALGSPLPFHRARNDDLRHGHGTRVHGDARGRLLQTYPQVAPRILEFLQVVLAHKTEELLDLLDFWT